ncbi:DUF1767 domain containing protein [Rhodotorula toruloides]|uniref:RecQ-mediated genome instability protein 1 n=1 Tax=Rhodotorula toruloides TaxID=5286 RepID=A0A511KS08_RHOTO|nr:DUF1767 domain containing protein [Rhodotorula toruloides]
MPDVPPALFAWYRASYPTLRFNPDWLEACVEYLKAKDPAAATVPGLIKAVEVQLLSSDLSTSVLPAPSRRADLTTLHLASSRTILFPGGVKKAGVLFQVQRVDDIAHSASHLQEVLRGKKEARRVRAKGANTSDGRIMNLDPEDEDEDETEKKILPAGVEPPFPRGSGNFVLSDGETEVQAFELRQVFGLGLEEIKLGTKLLIHDIPFVNGILMLTPNNTVVKGYQVEEIEAVKEWIVENGLRERLGEEPLPHSNEAPPAPAAHPHAAPPANPPAARSAPATARASPRPGPKASSSDYGDFEIDETDLFGGADEDEEEALRATEEEVLAQTPAAKEKGKETKVKPEPVSSGSMAGRKGMGEGLQKTRLSGEVEVLELDSDEDDEDEVAKAEKTVKRRKTAGWWATSKKGVGGPQLGVMEIDSD